MRWLIPLIASLALPLGCGGSDDSDGDAGAGGSDPGLPIAGIPEPAFGVAETVESIYGSPDHFTYYVDNTHPAATDDANPNGSPDEPRLTIPEDLAAGDVVEIHGGPYLGDELRFTGSGTAEQPIFVRGQPNDPPIVRVTFESRGGYQIYENLDCDLAGDARPCFTVSGNADVPDAVHHVAIRHNELHNYNSDLGATGNSSMIAVGNSHNDDGEYVHDIVIHDNHIHDNGDATQAERDIHGVGVAANARDVWIIDNHMHHNSGDSVQVHYYRAPPYNLPTRIYIGRNEIHDDQENAVDLKGCRGVVIYQNRMYSYQGLSQGVAQGYGTAVVIHEADEHAENVLVLNNEIWGCTSSGITVSHDADEIYLIGNIIHGNAFVGTDEHAPSSPWYPGAGIRVRNNGRTHIHGNLISNSHHGIISVGGDGHSIVVRNNLVANLSSSEGSHLFIESSSVAAASEADHNLFFQEGAALRATWGSDDYTDIAALASGSGQCASCISADPAFVDAAALDFHPTPSSATVDVGGDIGPVTEALFGFTLEQDFDGKPRPVGAAWDIGPYELAP